MVQAERDRVGTRLLWLSLAELFSVRHCVFVLGAAGSAKSCVWQALAKAQTNISHGGGKTAFATLNPKAVSSNELYGYINPVTKEPNGATPLL